MIAELLLATLLTAIPIEVDGEKYSIVAITHDKSMSMVVKDDELFIVKENPKHVIGFIVSIKSKGQEFKLSDGTLAKSFGAMYEFNCANMHYRTSTGTYMAEGGKPAGDLAPMDWRPSEKNSVAYLTGEYICEHAMWPSKEEIQKRKIRQLPKRNA